MIAAYFEVPTGRWFDGRGRYLSHGYAGRDEGKNNLAMQNVPDVGPIPLGDYEITEQLDLDELKARRLAGPVMRLQAMPGTETYGRSGFLIHGDSIAAPGTGSHGCPVADKPTRFNISAAFLTGQKLVRITSDMSSELHPKEIA
jgi:hypothetical protein